MSQLGENIEIYLMDGTTSGRWQAKLLNWNCEVYKIPRKMFKDCNKIDDLHTPAVYFLFGLDNESEKRFVYVGEGEDALKRIMQPHGFESDDSYWTEAVIFVTPDGTLDKAKIKYLENRFHRIVVDSGRYIVKNGNTPKQSTVQQKIQDMLERFIMNSRLVMPSLGHDVFEPQPSANKVDNDDLLYFSRNNGQGGNAVGRIENDGFWVLKGSYINPNIASYLPSGVVNLRKRYSSQIDSKGILQMDICFGSPSYASSFVCGKNSNGLIEWKNKNGKTLKEINDDGSTGTIKSKTSVTPTITSAVVDVDDLQDENILHLSGKRYTAFAIEREDGFLVKKGSQFADKEANSCAQSIINHRNKLISDGKVVNGVFTEDVLFSSPSIAAACIFGINTNGRTAWLNKDGKTLKDLQDNN